jgi:hypothetical protein
MRASDRLASIGRKRNGQDLQRDVTRQRRIARAVDLAHPAGAECRHDFI